MVKFKKQIIWAVCLTLIYSLVLLTCYYLHTHYFKIDVIFYATLTDLVISLLLCVPILFYSDVRNLFSHFEKLQLIIIWLLGGYGFAISLPTVLDRSLSLYFLEAIHQNGDAINEADVSLIFKRNYMHDYRAMDMRISEQVASGTIEVKNGCVFLTPKGKRVNAIAQFFRREFLPEKQMVRGQIVDKFSYTLDRGNMIYACKHF